MEALTLVKSDGKLEVLRELEVPKKFFNRMKFGVQVLDEIFGGAEMPGVLPGCSLLFTGSPGAGKSTMALQLADLLQKNAGRNVVYNLGEENKYMVKMRADRIGIQGDFGLSSFDQVDELVEFCRRTGVEVLFQDSIQSLHDGDLRGPALLKSITKKLAKLAESDGVTVFAIGHVTKGGGFAGPQELAHDVDACIHLRLNKDTGNRVFEFTKNRFGPAGMPYEFVMSAAGLDFQPVRVEEEETVSGRQAGGKLAQRRDAVLDLIKEKLLEGERISGYCFERFEVDCSGGFWRGMLARAVRELQAEGHTVLEKVIDRRAHSYVERKQADG